MEHVRNITNPALIECLANSGFDKEKSERFSELFGLLSQHCKINPYDLLDAATNGGLLFSLPETLHANVRKTARLLGVTEAKFIEAALKQPALFYQKPETIARHAQFIRRAHESIGRTKISDPAISLEHPINLSRSDGALLGRFLVIQQCGMGGTVNSIMGKPNSQIQSAVFEHYQGRLQKGPGNPHKLTRTMQQLHRLGVITELPEGVAPMKPRSR